MPAIALRTDLSAADLWTAAGEERDGRVVRRLLVLANVLDGLDRDAAARMAGMQRQTLRDLVHRYNAHGVVGLRNSHGGGARAKLSEGEQAALVALVLSGPDPARDDTRVWRLEGLCRVVEERFGVAYADSGMFDLLARLVVSWMTTRPHHPSSDPKAQAALKKTSRRRSPPSPPRTPRPSGSRACPRPDRGSGSSTRAVSGRRGG